MPTMRLCSSSSMWSSRLDSSSVSLNTGMPVLAARTSAMSSSSTSATTSMSPDFHWASRAAFSWRRLLLVVADSGGRVSKS